MEQLLEYNKKEIPNSVLKFGLSLSVIGLILVVIAYLFDNTRSAYNNIILLMFLTSLGVGALFLVAIEYIFGAVWSVPFRRISEIMASILIVLPIIAIPVYLNMHDLFHWTHVEDVAKDKILSGKTPYLNETFFLIRLIFYFSIWILFWFLLRRNSEAQDKNSDQLLTKRNISISAGFMPVFAITLTFISIDLMMSLEPHWYSTIFGVYYFAGTILAALAAATFIIVNLNDNGFLVKGIVKDHYYSLGALIFAFTNFWAYIAFSQFLLIWYANIPEETIWFLQRWHGDWKYISLGLIVVRFLVPYIALITQPSKSRSSTLKFVSVWILVSHLYDLYWLVMPTYGKENFVFGWIEISFIILALGIAVTVFTLRSKNVNMVPLGDPKLKRGLDFRL